MDRGCFRSRHANSSAALWKLNAASRSAAIRIQPFAPVLDRLAAHVDDGKQRALMCEQVAPRGSGRAVGKFVIYVGKRQGPSDLACRIDPGPVFGPIIPASRPRRPLGRHA